MNMVKGQIISVIWYFKRKSTMRPINVKSGKTKDKKCHITQYSLLINWKMIQKR